MTTTPPAPVPAYITQLLESAARDGAPGVTFHPDDPHAEAVTLAAKAAGLAAVPDHAVPFRSIQPLDTLEGEEYQFAVETEAPVDEEQVEAVRRAAAVLRPRLEEGALDDLVEAMLLPVRAALVAVLRAVVTVDDTFGGARDHAD